MDDPSAALKTLDASLDSLEAAVAPLLVRTRAQTLESLDSTQKAKMDVLLAFAINNLVWIYLKSRGIDPEEHDVTRELERIKAYYGKVRAAEGESASKPRVNVPAANRIIKHSLPSNRSLPATSAAAAARAQAAAATASEATTSNRFRFVATETEKVIPGEGEDMEVDGAETEGRAAQAQAEADNLLDSVEAEIVADEVAKSTAKSKKTKGQKAKKRKRVA